MTRADMAGFLDGIFAFAIGDLVYFKSSSHHESQTPNAFCIVERVLQQCHGGVQKLYLLSPIDQKVPEVALTRERPEFDRSVMFERLQAEREWYEKRKADREHAEGTAE